MGRHVEWVDAPENVWVAVEGQVVEGRRLDDGTHAVVVDGDDMVIITGTREHLIRMLATALGSLAML